MALVKNQLLMFSTAAFIAFGCTRNPQANDGQVSSIIATKIDQQVEWDQGCVDERIHCKVQELLENELTSESAIQIAFLKNPKVQAIFEELGIAHADLVEAGLLSNPAFEAEVRYPHIKHLRTNIEYLLTATFLDIFLIPLRTRLATAELEQAKRRVADEILELAFDVRRVYYELLAARQRLKLTQAIVELMSIQSEMVSRQFQVGNVNHLEFQQIESKYLEANLEIAREQSHIIQVKEKVNRLLGLSEDSCLKLPDAIPQEVDFRGFALDALESIALEERLDLQAARFEVIRLRRMLGLKEGWTYTNLNAGVAGERDPDGTNLVGFGLSGEIPIFNYGQAARMRIAAQLRQAHAQYAALEISVMSEVREAYQLLMNDLEMIDAYREKILPMQQQVLKSTEEQYNVMGLGVDRLLENKRQALEVDRNYLEMLKMYWITRVQLDQALGGYLFRLIPDREGVNDEN